MARVLDGPFVRVQSMSDPKVSYRIWALGTPQQWCECPAYKYQRLPVSQRQCKHTTALLTGTTVVVTATA